MQYIETQIKHERQDFMLTDIEIAQKCRMKPITEVAASLGINEDELELYGNYKAKLADSLWQRVRNNKDGKLILVTAINPTPAGEGKTTITVGLGQALAAMGKKAVICLREPSLGPVMGMKGGAAGGGHAQLVPMEDINLHFTGDIHAVTAANNLLSAVIDNHIQHGNALQIDLRQIVWKGNGHERQGPQEYCRWTWREGKRHPEGGQLPDNCGLGSHGHTVPVRKYHGFEKPAWQNNHRI